MNTRMRWRTPASTGSNQSAGAQKWRGILTDAILVHGVISCGTAVGKPPAMVVPNQEITPPSNSHHRCDTTRRWAGNHFIVFASMVNFSASVIHMSAGALLGSRFANFLVVNDEQTMSQILERSTPRNSSSSGFDPRHVRRDFPIFEHNADLVFLDSAASAQKPAAVIDGVAEYYRKDYANIHRGVYRLSSRSTDLYEAARETVRRFLNAADAREIVFVRNATEGINLVAGTWGAVNLGIGDEVIITELEHHSNIVPWQLLRERKGFTLRAAPVDATGALDLGAFERMLSPRTKLVAVTHVANSIGTLLPVEAVIRLAHAHGAKVLIDGCQTAPRLPVDVRALDCDFFVFSGHKAYGPTGIGVVYGKLDLLDEMPPWQGGGGMIRVVSIEKTTFQDLPLRFDAGTPDISGAIGLALAIDYMERLGRDALLEHEQRLTEYCVERLSNLPGVRVVGAGLRQLSIVSFDVDGIHPHDVASVLDRHGIAVRAGHHCAQPLMERLNLAATIRVSFGAYNDEADVDALVCGVEATQQIFAR